MRIFMILGRTKTLVTLLFISCIIHVISFAYYATSLWKERAKFVSEVQFLLPRVNDSVISRDIATERSTTSTKHAAFRSFKTSSVPNVVNETDAAVSKICQLPEVIHDGVPWSICAAKFNWMKNHWKSDACYAENGVSDDSCSILKYLSEREKHCPPSDNVETKLPPLFLKGAPAIPRTEFQHLYNELSSIEDYSWIVHRIKSMEDLWKNNSKHAFPSGSPERKKKRILLHMGLMKLGLGKSAWTGGPLGELVQWSDLTAALYIMGHEVVITSKKVELAYVFKPYIDKWGNSGCPPMTLYNESIFPFDIIYTDINGYKEISTTLKPNQLVPMRCRFRIVDSFGTEASFNHPPYRSAKHLRANAYSGLDLLLPQFNTMFPHTPDNTFLGFVIESPASSGNSTSLKRDIALVYGKLEAFWKGKENYINIVKEYVDEVHATVHQPKNLSSGVINHGVVNSDVLNELYRRTKIFVGLGFPFEGPAPLEAIQNGAVFLNPKFSDPISSENNQFYAKKPTRRKITSQNPYAEVYIGKPHVYTVEIENEAALREALSEIVNSTHPGAYLPHEFSTRGMLERLSVQVEKQQFCVNIPYSTSHSNQTESLRWPPLSSLVAVAAKQPSEQSCNEICHAERLICEPSFFPILNRAEGFHRDGIRMQCNEVKLPEHEESDFPAYDKNSGTCYLQNNVKLFSCAENYRGLQRLCPCRDYQPSQAALCKNCGLT